MFKTKTPWLVMLSSVAGAAGACSGGEDSRVAEAQTDALTVPDGMLYGVRIASSGKCASVSNASQADGAPVVQVTCSNTARNQQWELVSIESDVYQVRPAHSGKCLNVSGNSQNDGAPVVQWGCSGANNERFRLEIQGAGLRIRALHSSKCLEIPNNSSADGTQFVQRTCNGNSNQRFQPVAAVQLRVGDALPGLSATNVAEFETGKDDFAELETVADGLGPIFNDTGCGACHSDGAVGGGSDIIETRFGRSSNGVFDELASLGGSLRQLQTIGSVQVNGQTCNWALEQVPSTANRVGGRRSTALFGLGLVDLLPDSTFEALAAGQPAAVRGRVSRTTNFLTGNANAVGKFGWKGQNPTLFQFSGDAYLFEMGITNSLAPGIAPFGREQCPNQLDDCAQMRACDPVPGIDDEDENGDGVSDGVVAFSNFMKFLAPPPRSTTGFAQTAGEAVFNRIGCASCHTASFTTPNTASLPAPMRARTFHPYSDFLLHDMGTSADQIQQGSARATDMRTAPLWGLRFMSAFFHDGSATSVTQAIQKHAGQGQAAASAFNGLSNTDRSNLLAFLNSL